MEDEFFRALQDGRGDPSFLLYGRSGGTMLSAKQKKAVRLLFEMPEDRVAKEVGVRLSTLRRWMGRRDFVHAMDAWGREGHDAAVRISSQNSAHAAAKLQEIVTGKVDGASAKLDAKTLVDLLKGGGILKEAADTGSDSSSFDMIAAQIAARNGDTYDPAES